MLKKKWFASVVTVILVISCMLSVTPVLASAEQTLAQVYIRTDGNPVAYDEDPDASVYDFKTQSYLTTAEACYSLDGVEDRLVRVPSIPVEEGKTILWYEIVKVNGKWRLHGVITDIETEDPDVGEETGKTIELGIVTPKKMSVRFEDGKIYQSGDSLKIEIGKTYKFQMCSNNWDNDIYDDNGNGLCGTVVYSVRVSNRYDERSYDEDSKTFVLPKGDPVLRTDVNSCFMAYRYHFTKGDYNKQTGIENVVNTPLESLSVNLPLGSTISSDAYIDYNQIASANVFIERGEDLSLSYTDYYWEY